jgi:hypothetical protein
VDRLRRDRLAVTTVFAGRPRAPWQINPGSQLAALVLMGALLGAWT